VVGEIIKVKWWGYQGQLVGEIIKVKWWGYLGQVVGISRPSGGDIKVRGRGLEVKVKKKVVGGACPLQLPLLLTLAAESFSSPGLLEDSAHWTIAELYRNSSTPVK
jgi:hypothetical protein